MKNLLFLLFLILIVGCNSNTSENPSKKSNQQKENKYANFIFEKPTFDSKYNFAMGILFWKGKSLSEIHNGAIKLRSGLIYLDNNNISGAKIDIPMDELIVTDLKDDDKFKFEDHLKSSDFFNTAKYPNATFYITSVEKNQNDKDFPLLAIGVLDLVGIKNEVKVPFTMNNKDTSIYIQSNYFSIDRTKWNLTYKSKILGLDLDKVIDDKIRLKFKFFAHKTKSQQ